MLDYVKLPAFTCVSGQAAGPAVERDKVWNGSDAIAIAAPAGADATTIEVSHDYKNNASPTWSALYDNDGNPVPGPAAGTTRVYDNLVCEAFRLVPAGTFSDDFIYTGTLAFYRV
jgi:hypothetical protein